MITGEAKHILNPQNRGRKQVGLEGNAIAITAGHLKNRLKPPLLQQTTGCQGAQSHYRTLLIGDIDCIHPPSEQLSILKHLFDIHTFRRADLCGDHKLARLKRFTEIAHNPLSWR